MTISEELNVWDQQQMILVLAYMARKSEVPVIKSQLGSCFAARFLVFSRDSVESTEYISI